MSRRNDIKPMSIDAALDMERQEILALLGNASQTGTSPQSNRSSSPYATRNPPPRSMLDIDEVPGSPGHRPAPTVQAPVRSMLDFGAPPPQKAKSRGSSPVAAQAGGIPHSRSMSDANLPPADFGPRRSNLSGRNDPTAAYQFNPLPSAAQSMPKRTTQPSNRSSQQNSLGDALRNPDLSSMRLPGERGRNQSVDTRLSGQSRSPNGRIASRSRSPAPYSPSFLPSNKAYLNDGTMVDLSGAYRKLSDANMAMRGSSLSQPRKQSDDQSGRLAKSYIGPDGEDLPSSDEDDEEDFSSDDDEERGRKQAPRPLSPEAARDKGKGKGKSTPSPVATRETKSLLAAAEEERKMLETQPKYQYKSLFPEPEIKITNTLGDSVKASKNAVHPHTSYDHGPTATVASAMESDDEADLDEIKRAQKLSFSMTNIISTPESNRSIRIINRGAYTQIAAQEDARQRKYLVATDLSGESTHALEWAIGTVLRDGDTLIAIYCVDEETGIGGDESTAEDTKTMKEQAAAVNNIASSKSMPSMNAMSDLRRGSMFPSWRETTGTPGASPAPSPRGERSKAELERHRAVGDITDRVLRLLRKTQLQVRVVVEVLHCKNPKHLITEVIDLVNPTLVVIGSRGRSALKGVILGSFSNYLVTKSSVPVMVARKRLRKQGKYKGKAAQRQINNISNPSARSLVNAKID